MKHVTSLKYHTSKVMISGPVTMVSRIYDKNDDMNMLWYIWTLYNINWTVCVVGLLSASKCKNDILYGSLIWDEGVAKEIRKALVQIDVCVSVHSHVCIHVCRVFVCVWHRNNGYIIKMLLITKQYTPNIQTDRKSHCTQIYTAPPNQHKIK